MLHLGYDLLEQHIEVVDFQRWRGRVQFFMMSQRKDQNNAYEVEKNLIVKIMYNSRYQLC